MRGQYRILNEILIFTFGVAITSFVVISFQNVQDSSTEISLKDQLSSVSSIVAMGIVKAVESGYNSTIYVWIPQKLSGYQYKIKINTDNVTVSTISNPQITASQQLFNISQSYNIIETEVQSSAEHIWIEFVEPQIIIKRE